MAIGPRLKWIKTKISKTKFVNLFYFFISLIISVFVLKYSEVKYLFSTVLFAASFFLFLKTIEQFFVKKDNFSQKISHFSFSIFILSILLNGIYSSEFSANMKFGEELKFNNNYIKFVNLETSQSKNYRTLITSFEIKDDKGKIIRLNPEVRIYNQPEILTSEADIKSNLFTDKFLVVNLLKDDGYFNVRYQVKPLMIWVWLSIILLA